MKPRRTRPDRRFARSLGPVVAGCALSAASAAAWTPESFGPLDRPPALRPLGEPATVLTREAFLTRRKRADDAALAAAWGSLDAGRLTEAAAAFERLKLRAPGDGRAAAGAALAALLAGEEDAARDAWVALLAEEPEALAYVNLGWDARLRVARARVLLRAGLPVDARPADTLFLVAVCDVLLRDFPLAQRRVDDARTRTGAGPHLRALAEVVARLRDGSIDGWAGTPPRPGVAPLPPRPVGAPRPAPAPVERPPALLESREPAPPREAPDLAAIARRLREAATAVGRFEVRLNERLHPLIVLPPDGSPADPDR